MTRINEGNLRASFGRFRDGQLYVSVMDFDGSASTEIEGVWIFPIEDKRFFK